MESGNSREKNVVNDRLSSNMKIKESVDSFMAHGKKNEKLPDSFIKTVKHSLPDEIQNLKIKDSPYHTGSWSLVKNGGPKS